MPAFHRRRESATRHGCKPARRCPQLAIAAAILKLAVPATAAEPATDFLDLLPKALHRCAVEKPDTRTAGWSRRSILVAVADGTRLALDIFLPAKPGAARRPTLFVSTRYWRAPAGSGIAPEFQSWIDDGYAVVVADVRGTGASFGQWYLPYSLQEARDVGFLANWIARQPWSDGRVVTTGNSYTGTTALLSPAFGAPAIRAAIPRFSDFDLYEDLLFPGGIPATRLITEWGGLVRGLDLNDPLNGMTVRPVDGPEGEALLAQAVADHRQVDGGFDQATRIVTFRDDRPRQFNQLSFAESGLYQLRPAIERAQTPILGWGSWMDSGIAQGMINRFIGWSNPQLSIIGPWTHGANKDADPFKPVDTPAYPDPRLQRRIDRCFAKLVLADRFRPDPQIIYYTMGEDRWKTASQWPVPGTRPLDLHLAAGGRLSRSRPSMHGQDTATVDFAATTGALNRWMTQAGAADIDYGDRRTQGSTLLTYDSPPLAEDVEVTGAVIAKLDVKSSAPDATFILYLEDVAPDGRVRYVSEGGLRAIHRAVGFPNMPYASPYPTRSYLSRDATPLEPGKLATLHFQLQPVSVLFRKGHRIRIAIAGADQGNFPPIPSDRKDVTMTILRGGKGSSITLPTVPRRRR